MEEREEYKFVSHTFKGESWDNAKSRLRELGFVETEGQHYKSPNTGVVYRFVLKMDGELFVTSIDVFRDNKYESMEYSVSDRFNTIHKAEIEEAERESVEEKIKTDLLYFLKTDAKWITDGLSSINYSYAVQNLKSYIGKKEDEPFFSIDLLSLEFEGINTICKLSKKRPSGVYRSIKTPCGTLYAVPISGTIEDYIDSILGFHKVKRLIGVKGFLDIYSDQDE